VQFVSQHPPLYYSILAPFVGPEIDKGNVTMAVAEARLITITIASLCIFAFAWAGWILGGDNNVIMAVALPAVGTSLVPFIKVSADIMNDSLLILSTILALTLSSLIIRQGLKSKYLIALSIVCLIGMSSKATFMGVFALSPVTIFVGSFINAPQKTKLKEMLKGFGWIAIIVLVVLAGIGWFYYRNWSMSGLWYRSGPQSWAAEYQNRPYTSLSEVIVHPKLWSLIPGYLHGNPWSGGPKILEMTINSFSSRFLFSMGLIGMMISAIRNRVWGNRDVRMWLVAGILIVYSALVFAEQIVHATGYGAINMRYMLPLWLPLTLFLCVGVASIKRLRGIGIIAIIIINWLAVITNSVWFLNVRYKLSSGINNPWSHVVDILTQRNGLPYILLPLTLGSILVGIILIGVSLWKLTSRALIMKEKE